MLSGRSLEVAGNSDSRKMIIQRHNPAYRPAYCLYKNMYKKVFLSIVLSLILLFTGCSSKTEKDPEATLESIRNVTVMVNVEGRHASGIVVANLDDYILVATVSHLVEGYDQAIITMPGGETVFGNVVSLDPMKDTSLLQIEKQYLDENFINNISVSLLSESTIDMVCVEDKVYLTGSAVGVSSNVTEGIIKSKDYFIPEFDENLLYIYGDAMAGMSGGGVFTKDGFLIGIIAAGSEASEVLAIPISEYVYDGGNLYDKN